MNKMIRKVSVLVLLCLQLFNADSSAVSPNLVEKQSPMIGNWNVFFANGKLVDPSIRTLHVDGRFEVTGLPQWNGRYQFTNAEKTQLKISCNNGRILTLDYKKDSDSMVEDTGAVFRRAKEQVKSAAQSATASNKVADSKSAAGTASTWYKFYGGEKYVTDFVLNPGMTKNVSIPSKKSLKVGFMTNATLEQSKKYQATAGQPVTGILMEQPADRVSVASVNGGGTTLTPKNNKIDLKLTNKIKETLKVVVYYAEE